MAFQLSLSLHLVNVHVSVQHFFLEYRRSIRRGGFSLGQLHSQTQRHWVGTHQSLLTLNRHRGPQMNREGVKNKGLWRLIHRDGSLITEQQTKGGVIARGNKLS